MSDTFTIDQTGRLLNIEWSGGPTSLIITGFSGGERISELFAFEIDCVSPLDAIAPDQVFGQDITWSVRQTDDSRRPFAGVIARLVEGRSFGRGYRHYRLDIRPALWLLAHTSNCKIFQNSTTPQIIESVLSAFPQVKYDLRGLTADYQLRIYCVQYRESDLAFICRLMEDEGIFYYFKHDNGSHTMVLGDSPNAWFVAMPTTVHYDVQQEVEGSIMQWHRKSRFRGGKWTQRDYNFENPGNSLNASVTTLLSPEAFRPFEYYDYPGGYMTSGLGETRSLLRMEAEEAAYQEAEARGNIAAFATGGRFTVEKDYYTDDLDSNGWVVMSIAHKATDFSHVTGEGGGGAPTYSNTFTCVDDRVKFRPPRVTPRPQISGLQIATVVGPADEEIYTDQYGRIKVQFPWDRLGQYNENSSCWIRVVQTLSGGKWGAEFIPRVGMEVLVSFLEGDPERPIIVGAAYNARNMPAYLLPTKKTRSVLRSKTYKGTGYNELSLEDATDNEEFFMHAQKDMNTKVLNNQSQRIDVNAVESVGLNKGVEVDNNMTQIVAGDFSIAVGPGGRGRIVSTASTTLSTGVGRSAYGLGDPDSAAKGSGNFSLSVEENMSETILQNRAEKVTQNKDTSVLQNYTIEVGETMTIKAGDRIILQAGRSQIVLEKDGTILINGQTINIFGEQQIVITSDIVKVN